MNKSVAYINGKLAFFCFGRNIFENRKHVWPENIFIVNKFDEIVFGMELELFGETKMFFIVQETDIIKVKPGNVMEFLFIM